MTVEAYVMHCFYTYAILTEAMWEKQDAMKEQSEASFIQDGLVLTKFMG